jgi:cobalt-zinc-cadmium efflux system outer membrane protein
MARGRALVAPEPSLTGGYKGVGLEGERLHGFVAGVAIPFPLLDRSQDEAARGRGRAKAARARLALETDLASAEVRGLRAQAAQLADAARRFRVEAMEPSRALVATAEAAYRGGELGILELVDAHRGALDAALQAVDLEWAARKARIDLDLAAGGASR